MRTLRESLLDDEDELVNNNDMADIMHWLKDHITCDNKKFEYKDILPAVKYNRDKTIDLDLTKLNSSDQFVIDVKGSKLPSYIKFNIINSNWNAKIIFIYNGSNIDLEGLVCSSNATIMVDFKKQKLNHIKFPKKPVEGVSIALTNFHSCEYLTLTKNSYLFAFAVHNTVRNLYLNGSQIDHLVLNKETVKNILKQQGIVSYSTNMLIK